MSAPDGRGLLDTSTVLLLESLPVPAALPALGGMDTAGAVHHPADHAVTDAGHVVGAAIEAPDPGALARFYADLLDWPVVHEEPGTAVLAAPGGSSFVVFQQADGYRAPVWPPVEGEQRPMMHLDVQVGDLDAAAADAVALGATVAGAQPQENVRVLLDPAGHPFCLVQDDG